MQSGGVVRLDGVAQLPGSVAQLVDIRLAVAALAPCVAPLDRFVGFRAARIDVGATLVGARRTR